MSKKAALIPGGAYGDYFENLRVERFLDYLLTRFYRLRNKKIKKMTSGMLAQKNSLIVDLGCGTGIFSPISSSEGKLIGVDISLFELKQYKRDKGDRVEVVRADIHDIPFKNDSVDMMVCVSVLEHLKDVEKAIKSIKDIVKKEGILILGYPIEYNILKKIFSFFIGPFWTEEAKRMSIEEFYANPRTHKTNYITIRIAIGRHFTVLQKQKIPLLIPFYEIVKIVK